MLAIFCSYINDIEPNPPGKYFLTLEMFNRKRYISYTQKKKRTQENFHVFLEWLIILTFVSKFSVSWESSNANEKLPQPLSPTSKIPSPCKLEFYGKVMGSANVDPLTWHISNILQKSVKNDLSSLLSRQLLSQKVNSNVYQRLW